MRVVVAMSGGVDSSVAAYILKSQGYDVVGVTLKLWGGESDSGCCSVKDVEDARRVAIKLGIDHRVMYFADLFEEKVVSPYIKSHEESLTPNPCIECNRHIKFSALFDRVIKLGFDALATGHYCRVKKINQCYYLKRSVDKDKDQSYVLSMLRSDTIKRLVFPVGDLLKSQVREIASKLNLPVSNKPDSQDVCFINSSEGRKGFLSQRIGLTTGNFIDENGTPLGEVKDIELLTIGQRMGVPAGKLGQRRYVLNVDRISKRVVIGPLKNLLVDGVKVKELTWAVEEPVANQEVFLQTSAHGTPFKAFYKGAGLFVFKEPQKRVAPGQTVAVYDANDPEIVLGSGVAIPEIIKSDGA
jgi:tRNA-specific 2-thiouridylase